MGDADSLGNYLTAAAVFGLMFSMGLSLTVPDFTRILRSPKPVALGLFGQFIALPAVAYLIAIGLNLPKPIAVGLMIIAACPGGSTSNAFSYIAKGDVALSISLTAVSSIIAFITVPIVIGLSLQTFGTAEREVSLSFWEMARGIFLSTALPVCLGLAGRKFFPDLAQKAVNPIFIIAFLGILAPSVLLVFDLPNLMRGGDAVYALSAALLNVIMVSIGYALGWFGKLEARQARTLGIEVGVQNFGLVLMIVLVFLQDPRFILPAFVYLPSMLLTGFAFGLVAMREQRTAKSASAATD